MKPTKPTLLIALAVLAGVIGWSCVELFSAFTGRSLPVPWTAPATLFVLALALFIWALGIRPRLARRPGIEPTSPFVAARTAALAMAASRTGAIVGGFYAGIAARLALSYANPAARERMWFAVAAFVGGLLVVLAALWLEHICRLPGDGDDEGPPPTHDDTGADWVHPSNASR